MSDSPRLLLCLATAKGRAAIEALGRIDNPSRHVVCTFPETDTEGDNHLAILERARCFGCNACLWKQVSDRLPEIIAMHQLNGIVAAGWRYLLRDEIYSGLRHGLLAFHDSLLPRHRGFAPLATALLCGDDETGVTVLRATAEMDAGDILWQERVPILPRDRIVDLISRVEPVYADLLARLLQSLDEGRPLPRHPQHHEAATYSVWRGPEDGCIDWTRSAVEIDRLIRAAGYPYPGAFTTLEGERIVIEAVELADDVRFSLREPGKVWRLEDGQPIVVCGKGMLRITAACTADGRSHLPLHRLRIRYQ